MGKRPKIANVFWRGEKAWGKIKHGGRTFRQPLDTTDPATARQRVQKWRQELEGQRWGEKPRRSFDEAATRFIDEHLPRLKPRGAQRYLQSLKMLVPTFEGKMLDEIGSALLSDFEGNRRRDGVSSGTIRNDLWCLSAMMTCAMEWEWIEGNKVSAYIRARAKRGMLPPSPPRTRYLSHDEEAELLRRCAGKLADVEGNRSDHIMLAAAMGLTIDIGLRKEELLDADWSMVDLERNEWNVPAALAKTGRKTGLGRTVPILPRSREILLRLPRSDQTSSVIWHAERRGDGGLVHVRYFDLLPMLLDIASGGRAYITKRELSKLAERGVKATDARRAEIAKLAEASAWSGSIPELIWHDLRRTCGCRLLQDYRMPIERVSKWLGHASIDQTQRAYAFLDVKHLHDAVAGQLGAPGALPAPEVVEASQPGAQKGARLTGQKSGVEGKRQ
jgi:integrase/recombinase XerD